MLCKHWRPCSKVMEQINHSPFIFEKISLNYFLPGFICLVVVVQSLCLTLRDPMHSSMTGFPVLYHLLELAQTHAHWVNVAMQPSHSHCPPPLLSSIFPESGFFPISWLLTSSGQSIGASASEPVLPMNIQGWFPLRLTGLISWLSKGLSRVFSSTIWKHQFFGAWPSLWSNSHIRTWLLENS